MSKPYPTLGQALARPAHQVHPTRSAAAGFTLVESLFVLVIIGIMASILTPMFAPDRWRADSAVQEVALGLNAAQRLAVLRQHDIVVTFELSERRLRVLHDQDNNGEQDSGEEYKVIELPETMGFGSGSVPTLPQGSGPISFGSGHGDPTLTFHRNGSASASGVIYLRPMEGRMATSAEAVRALTIERSTGEVRCYSYRSGNWEASC